MFFLPIFFLVSSLTSGPIDHSIKHYELKQKKRVDIFDFSGEYPELENIDIDARRKKKVEIYLTGNYPNLESVNYEGSFGTLNGKLTGNFPLLKTINIICTDCAMNFDLNGNWEKDCEIHIGGIKEDICLKLPNTMGVVVYTKVGVKGKVFASGLKKKGVFGIFNKTYFNELAAVSSNVLTIYVETVDGRIILESEGGAQMLDETES